MRALLALALLVGLAAGLRAETTKVGDFSAAPEGVLLPPSWSRWVYADVGRPTRYKVVAEGQQRVVRAVAQDSASGLIRYLRADPRQQPAIEWRWRVLELPAGADLSRAEADDAAARLCLLFGGTASAPGTESGAPAGRGTAPPQAELPAAPEPPVEDPPGTAPAAPAAAGTFGRALPSAAGAETALCYVWASAGGTSTLSSPTSERVKVVPVQSGSRRRGDWVRERRNLLEDYRQAFGGESPGPIVALALLTDADDTGGSATAYYGDVVLHGRE